MPTFQKGVLGVSLREVSGPIGDLLEKLASDNGNEWLNALRFFLRRKPSRASQLLEPHLQFIEVIEVTLALEISCLDLSTVCLHVDDRFKLMFRNWQQCLRDGDKNVATRCQVHQVRRNVSIFEVVTDIEAGGDIGIPIGAVAQMLWNQGSGKKGDLNVVLPNIIFVQSNDYSHSRIVCSWSTSGWCVEMREGLFREDMCLYGYRVVSREP